MSGWTLKLVACCVLTACCALSGRALCGKERRRAELLCGLAGAMPLLMIEMTERLTPLIAALVASGDGLLRAVAACMEQGRGAREAWLHERGALTAKGNLLDSLLDEDLSAIEQLFDGLGASGISAQRLLLESSERRFKSLCEQASKRAQERGKLYTNLGLLFGLAISVCLI